MRYDISIGGRKAVATSLEKKLEDGSVEYHVEIPVLKCKLNFVLVQEGQDEINLSNSEKLYHVKLVKSGSKSTAFLVNGRQILAEIKSPESNLALESASSVANVGENVVSNFPARVIKVNAKDGDRLSENQTLIVVEAMKMEAHIKVPRYCVVSEILVSEGDRIEKGRLLARLKFI
ncbi:MAG: acyl-CoA carboxylase biotin carboxyl carrier protein subunit [Nitrososphaerales archaeon]